MPQKPIKRGFKVWCSADAHNGFLKGIHVYTGATTGSTEHGLGASVVKQLSEPLRGKGHHLYFDNFFSSVDLAQDLLKDQLYCVATTRINRKLWPSSLKDVKARNKTMSRGDYASVLSNSGDVECLIWKDNKCVPFLNTITKPGTEDSVNRKAKDGNRQAIKCPKSVKLYNQYMGGVDIADARRKNYSCSRRSRKWWMRLLYYLLDVCRVNSYILAQESPYFAKMTMKEFVLNIAEELMKSFNSRKRPGRSSDGPPSARFCERHFPHKVDEKQACRFCSTAQNRVRTSYCCSDCNPDDPIHLCPFPCFKLYHTK